MFQDWKEWWELGPKLKDAVRALCGSAPKESVRGHKVVLGFEFEGRPRTILYDEGDVRLPLTMPVELLGGYDVYFEKKLDTIIQRGTYALFYGRLRLGGFVLHDTPLLGKMEPEAAGFERIELPGFPRFASAETYIRLLHERVVKVSEQSMRPPPSAWAPAGASPLAQLALA